MPVDVTMKKPRAWIVGAEAERNVILSTTNVQDITPYWIRVVVRRAPRCPYDVKCVLDATKN